MELIPTARSYPILNAMAIEAAHRSIADIRQRASTPRRIDLRTVLRETAQYDKQASTGTAVNLAGSRFVTAYSLQVVVSQI